MEEAKENEYSGKSKIFENNSDDIISMYNPDLVKIQKDNTNDN